MSPESPPIFGLPFERKFVTETFQKSDHTDHLRHRSPQGCRVRNGLKVEQMNVDVKNLVGRQVDELDPVQRQRVRERIDR